MMFSLHAGQKAVQVDVQHQNVALQVLSVHLLRIKIELAMCHCFVVFDDDIG